MKHISFALVFVSFLALAAVARGQGQDQTGQQVDFYAPDPALRGYVEQALVANPAVQEALSRYRALLQRVPQLTSLPDPMLSVNQSIRRPETRVGSQLNTVMLSQSFPWFGKLDLRGKLAVQEAVAGWERYAARQRQVVADVKRAYHNLAFTDEAIRISEEERSLLQHYEQLAQTRYATGQGLQQAVIKIQAEITRVVNRLQILEQQRETLVARLNNLRSRPPAEPVPPVARPGPLPPVKLDLEALYELGSTNRQELLASEALIERNERAVELARKSGYPDLTIGASYGNILGRDVLGAPADNGKDTLGVSVGINLPIWRGKYRAEVQQAAEQLTAERQNRETIWNDVQFAIRDQAVRLETLREQVGLFQNVLIPQSEEALRSTEAAYQTGQLGVLDLLDSERTLLQVRLGNVRQIADYLVALTDLERAIGTRFPE